LGPRKPVAAASGRLQRRVLPDRAVRAAGGARGSYVDALGQGGTSECAPQRRHGHWTRRARRGKGRMNLWQGILLGLIQGLTEFLPVSSDGHLAVIAHVTGVRTPGVFVEVALHVATLGSILVVYGGRFWR